MIKGLFLCAMDFDISNVTGESKKVKEQVEAFNSIGFPVKLFEPKYHKKTIRKILRRLPYYPEFGYGYWKQVEKYINKNIDFIYIRMSVIDRGFINLLKKIKKKSPQVKIALEIPTYPYAREWTRVIDIPFFLKDKMSRVKLKKYVDKVVTPANVNMIFGIPTVQINNAIKVKHFYSKPDINKETFNLIAVAHVRKCHGYDRVIKGLKKYYDNIEQGEPEVSFNLVGDGEEVNRLKKMVCDLGISKYVIFLGKKTGTSLEKLFEKSDIAIGTLSPHKINLRETRSLKHREYCAQGIPFLYAGHDGGFPPDFKFALCVLDDDSVIDIRKIVEYHSELMKELNNMEIVLLMQNYAKKNLSWDTEMKKVIEGLYEKNS